MEKKKETSEPQAHSPDSADAPSDDAPSTPETGSDEKSPYHTDDSSKIKAPVNDESTYFLLNIVNICILPSLF